MANNDRYGWTNYETWCIALWIDNDQGEYENIVSMAVDCLQAEPDTDRARWELAWLLKDGYEEQVQELDMPGMFQDLLGAALNAADWGELARHFIEAALERLPDPNEAHEAHELPEASACPECGERLYDSLVWREDESGVDCASCGHFWDPNAAPAPHATAD